MSVWWEHLAEAVGALRRAGAQSVAEDDAAREAKAAQRARAAARAPVSKMAGLSPGAGFAEKRDSKAACCIASRKLKNSGDPS